MIDVDNRGNYACMRRKVYGKSMYLSLNFYCKPETALKKKRKKIMEYSQYSA